MVIFSDIYMLLGRIACTECKHAAYCYRRCSVVYHLPVCICYIFYVLNYKWEKNIC